jgi:uncharacterized protein YbbC (DUF1343 family)
VQPGCAALIARRKTLLRGARVGLLAHQASVLPDLTTLYDRLLDDPSVHVTALFGPEHGLFADAQDQAAVAQATYRGRPVFSLYSSDAASLRPAAEALSLIDVLVIDLQDVGARYYTFVYTMAHCLETCGAAGIPMIVCDRPNPLGGVALEGPVLESAFASFVGRYPLPVRHAMTIGELARMWNAALGFGAKLTVLPCRGWRRAMWFDRTGLPWICPSPNMPTLDTAIVYPGGCLVEGTNLSEGRGTTRPFEMVGAPFLDGQELAARLNDLALPGVYFRPINFTPAFHKFAGRRCGGVFVHVTDRRAFRPFRTYLELVAQARAMAPHQFRWRTEPYEFETDRLAFDLLCGTDRIRLAIEAGASIAELERAWRPGLRRFAAQRKPYLLYGAV